MSQNDVSRYSAKHPIAADRKNFIMRSVFKSNLELGAKLGVILCAERQQAA